MQPPPTLHISSSPLHRYAPVLPSITRYLSLLLFMAQSVAVQLIHRRSMLPLCIPSHQLFTVATGRKAGRKADWRCVAGRGGRIGCAVERGLWQAAADLQRVLSTPAAHPHTAPSSSSHSCTTLMRHPHPAPSTSSHSCTTLMHPAPSSNSHWSLCPHSASTDERAQLTFSSHWVAQFSYNSYWLPQHIPTTHHRSTPH